MSPRHSVWNCWAFALAVWIVVAGAVIQANQAVAYLASTSLRVRPAQAIASGKTNALALSSLDDGTVNDELAFANIDSGGTSHASTAYLTLAAGGGSTLPFYLYLDVPGLGDVNFNGLTDYSEVALGLTNEPSSGVLSYLDASGFSINGTLDAIWNRTAGQTTGSVSIHVSLPTLKTDLTFVHEFEIFQYQGILSYSVQAAGIPSTVSLLRMGLPPGVSNQITGPILLIRSNEVELGYTTSVGHRQSNGSSVNLHLASSAFLDNPITRTPLHGSYEGLLGFLNGFPEIASGGQGQYILWWLDLMDSNDANQNGIPDLSDPPFVPPVVPQLNTHLANGQLALTIQASPGQSVVLLQSPSLSKPSWTTNQVITLSGSTAVINLPGPEGTTRFFQAR